MSTVNLCADVPLCLEHDKKPCPNVATHEIRTGFSDQWGALCGKCTRHWAPSLVRPLTEERVAFHFWVQTRIGGRLRTNARGLT